MKKRICLLLFIVLIVMTGCESKNKESVSKILKNNEMLSYTIDGEKTDFKPTKEDGYIVNKIICDNGSDMMWDNDNWEVELTKINSKDRCKVDFTKNTNAPGYRITVTSNMPSSLDSLSKATTLNGTVIIYSKSKIESVTKCSGIIIDENKVIVNNINTNQTCDITIEDKTLTAIIKKAYPSSGPRSSFSSVYTTTALHTATDYSSSGAFNGTTYYFTGNPDNWVSFAGKLWRIIRINGNGSVRLLYAGSGSTDGYIGSAQTYNNSYNHPAYVGWKYTASGSLSGDRGNANKSNAYSTVETWYNGLSSTDKNYIDTGAIYCNDRSIGSGSYSTSATFYYAGYQRFAATKGTPTLECNAADRFTTFGLMTADEVAYAGGLWSTNNGSAYYYLNASGGSSTGSNWWWTMSPYGWSSTYSTAWVFFVGGSSSPGYLSNTNVNDSRVVRPVISLKPEVIVTGGDGSASTPYEVTLP